MNILEIANTLVPILEKYTILDPLIVRVDDFTLLRGSIRGSIICKDCFIKFWIGSELNSHKFMARVITKKSIVSIEFHTLTDNIVEEINGFLSSY